MILWILTSLIPISGRCRRQYEGYRMGKSEKLNVVERKREILVGGEVKSGMTGAVVYNNRIKQIRAKQTQPANILCCRG